MSSSESDSSSNAQNPKTAIHRTAIENSDEDLKRKIAKKHAGNLSILQKPKYHSTPLQTEKLSSKALFQSMLMGSNSKLTEMLKNKQNLLKPKGLSENAQVRAPKSHSSSCSEKRDSSQETEFEPPASSTQINTDASSSSPATFKKKHKKELKNNSDDKRVWPLNEDYLDLNKHREVSNDDNSDHIKKVKKKKTRQEETETSNLSNLDINNATELTFKLAKKKKIKSNENMSSLSEISKMQQSNSTFNEQSFSKQIKQLQKFEIENKSLKPVTAKYEFHLKPHEELFVVQIPKNLDPTLLIGTNISCSKPTRVPESTRKYDCLPSSETQASITLFTHAGKLQLLQPMKTLHIQRHVKSKDMTNLDGCGGDKVLFPNNLKERHPLFGVDYSQKINLEDHIQQKLHAALESYCKQKKKKKKHKKEKQDSIVSKEEEIFQFLGQSDRKRSVAPLEPEGIPEVRKKKKDKQIDFAGMHSDQEALTEKKKHKKHKKDKLELQEGEVVAESHSKKKSKKQRKSDESSKLISKILSESMKMMEMEASGHEEKKKRKHLHNSIFDQNADSISCEPQVKKKKKLKKEYLE